MESITAAVLPLTHQVTAILAYRLWEKRGRPLGSPEVDWFEAENQLATALAKNGAIIGIYGMGMEPEVITIRGRV